MTPTTPTAAPGVSVEVEQALKTLYTASAIIGNLPQQPGSNGGILLIDDVEAGRIEKDLDEAAKVLRTALLASAAGGQAEPVAEVVSLVEADLVALVRMLPRQNGLTPFDIGDSLYAAPPPPVGELQGVSDEEVKKALRDYGWFVTAENEANMRRALESFAASRPVAVGVSAAERPEFSALSLQTRNAMCLAAYRSVTDMPWPVPNATQRSEDLARAIYNALSGTSPTTKAGGAS